TDGNLHQKWHPQLKYTWRFITAEFALLNPIWFVGAILAVLIFWRRETRTPLNVYLFSMGVPVVVFYFLLSFHTRILENWIVPAVIPWFMLTVIWWQSSWPRVQRWSHWLLRVLRWILRFGIVLGLVAGTLAVVVAHDTKIIDKLIGRKLPPAKDLLHRVHG